MDKIEEAIQTGRDLLINAISEYVRDNGQSVNCCEFLSYVTCNANEEIKDMTFLQIKHSIEKGFIVKTRIATFNKEEIVFLSPEDLTFSEMVEMVNRIS